MMEALIVILVFLLLFTLVAAVDGGIEKARDSRAWGAVVLVAVLVDEVRDRVRDWRTSRKCVRLIGRYESPRSPW